MAIGGGPIWGLGVGEWALLIVLGFGGRILFGFGGGLLFGTIALAPDCSFFIGQVLNWLPMSAIADELGWGLVC